MTIVNVTSGGIDFVTKQAALQSWVVAASGLPSASVFWGQQLGSPRVAEPAIMMRLMTHQTTGIPWLLQQDSPLVVGALPVGVVTPSTDALTIIAHGLQTGDGPVQLTTTGTLPTTSTGALALLTNYWVIVVDANNVKLAATFAATGGAPGPGNTNPITPIDITSAGTGTMTVSGTSSTLRAGQEIQHVTGIEERVTLTLECYTSVGVGIDMATAVLHRIVSRQALPSVRGILAAANIGKCDVRNVRSINGRRDAVLWEPRAMLDVYLMFPSCEAEAGTIISSATATGTTSSPTSTIVTSVGPVA